MTIRVQVSCWCWAQVRKLHEVLPQFNPTVEDWRTEIDGDRDLIDYLLDQEAEPHIYVFYDVENQANADLIQAAIATPALVISIATDADNARELHPIVIVSN